MVERLINETDTVVMLPAYEVLGVPNVITPNGLIPLPDITPAAINHYAAVTSLGHANAGAGGNVSCALLTDMTLGFTDSNEDDEKTLCEPGNSVNLTDANFDQDFTGFRDANPNDQTSVFALYEALTFAPDVPYITVHRVGFASDVPFAQGQVIDAYYSHTDFPLAIYADDSNQKIQSVFVPKNEYLQNHILPA